MDAFEPHAGPLSPSEPAQAHLVVRDPVFKRPLDLLLSATGLVVSTPIWGIIVLAIWLEDGSPVLFRQVRIGRYGRPIQVMKFRSMVKGHARGELQAQRDDPRITRVGRILRRFSLDELPQLWSILRGDMSFVGPRAQPEREVVHFRGHVQEVVIRALPGFALRQQVRPGLTGIAQLFAPREVPHRYKFRYDLIYLRRLRRSTALRAEWDAMSVWRRLIRVAYLLAADLDILWLDLRLIMRSVWVAIRGKWET